MTAKRFTIIDEQFISYYGGTGHLISNGECKIWLWHSKEESQKVCDKLNSILDENEELKEAVYSWSKFYNRVYEEKESLKFQLNQCQNHKLFSRRKLEKENEHIKTTIQTMIETERTELGKSILKQLWEQIQ